MKHPFFTQENPAANLYRNFIKSGISSKKLRTQSLRDKFKNILDGTLTK